MPAADPAVTAETAAPDNARYLVRGGVVHRRRPLRVLPLLAVVVLGLGGAAAGQFLIVRPSVEADLTRSTRAALSAAGHPEVGVEVSGRDVTLSAVPASGADLAEITSVVLAVPGVHSVHAAPEPGAGTIAEATGGPSPTAPATLPPPSPTAPPPSPSPTVLTPDDPADYAALGAVLEENSLALVGAVPSPEVRDSLLQALSGTFAEPSIEDRTTIVEDAGTVGIQAFTDVLRALGPASRTAVVSLQTGQLRLAAVVPDQEVRSAVLAAATAAGGEAAELDRSVTVAAAGAPVTDAQVSAQLEALPTITFPTRSSELTPQSQAVVALAVELLRAHPRIELTVEGHTDAKGKPAANRTLSRTRAQAVRGAMVDAGVEPDRLTATGFGSSRPLSDQTGPLADALNRRVVFVASTP